MKISEHVVNLLKSFYKSIRRFPVSIALSASFAVIMIITSEMRQSKPGYIIQNLERVSMILALGFVLSLCIKLYFEKKGITKLYNIIAVSAVSISMLILYYFFLLKDLSMVSITRYAGISIALYILFAFIPYLDNKENFEIYIIKIFGRLFITIIYSAVLYGGLAAILATIDKLLEIKIPSDFYYYTFLIVAGIFAPSYYLGGFPFVHDKFTKENYPNIFKVLVLYIIMPLITIYTIILYIYFAKIIITAKWPVGLVSHLVLWYSVISAAVLFFISPIYKDNKFANKFMKVLPKVILPLIILMFFSVGIRIKAYGITENRYYVIALSLWVFGVMIYFSWSKKFKNIMLPVTLCIIILISVAGGPINSYSVSIASQNKRFQKILSANKMLSDNKIIKNSSIPQNDKNEISSILQYFNRSHNLSDMKYLPKGFKIENMENVFGFSFSEIPNYIQNYFYFGAAQAGTPIDITGYDYIFDSRNMNYGNYDGNESSLKINYDNISHIFKVINKNNVIYTKNLNDIAKNLVNKYGMSEKQNSIPQNDMLFTEENSKAKIKIIIESMQGERNPSTGEITVNEADYYILIKIL